MRHKTITPMKPIEAVPALLQGYVTRSQIAKHYRVAESTIRIWQRRDGLPVHRVGTQPLYDRAEVAEWFMNRQNRMRGGITKRGGEGRKKAV